ncbi:hypothetical protein ACFX2F_009614 [Malus domestica]|uniref:Uncharacterized protein n=1 Tax=Malus domestica TaxID=3750 RepID=A0A498IGP2_MALDO|nr:hypothetical protein DVH24_004585 [Malus domestica]
MIGKHNDWQCIVHLNKDRLDDLVEVTKKYFEVEVLEMSKDYFRNSVEAAEDISRDAIKGNIKDVLNDAKNVDVDVAKKDVVDSVEGGVGGMSKIWELKQTIAKLEKKNSSLTVEQDRIANALLAKKF